MMPVLCDLFRSDGINPHVPSPALRKEREGRGTHSVGDISEIKGLGHPASSYSGVPAANKTAIQNASVGLPPSTSAIVGMTGLIGIGKIF